MNESGHKLDQELEQETGQESPARTGVGVKARPSPPKILPRYRVLLHNDDINAIHQVIAWLTELTPLPHARAAQVTLEADMRGVSLVITTHLELAELYRDQLRTKRLTVTIEPEN